jgi:hypothetical protein
METKLTANQIISTFLPIEATFVNTTEEGELCLEYFHKHRWLTFYINEDETVDYLYGKARIEEEGQCNDIPTLITLRDKLLEEGE